MGHNHMFPYREVLSPFSGFTECSGWLERLTIPWLCGRVHSYSMTNIVKPNPYPLANVALICKLHLRLSLSMQVVVG